MDGMAIEWLRIIQPARVCRLLPCNTRIESSVPLFETDASARCSQPECPSLLTLTGTAGWVERAGHLWSGLEGSCSMVLRGSNAQPFSIWINAISPSSTPTRRSGPQQSVDGSAPLELINQSPQQLRQRISHAMSDAICFASDSIKEAAEQYVNWIDNCSHLRGCRVKPIACIAVPKACASVKDFNAQCRWVSGSLKEQLVSRASCFDEVIILPVAAGATKLPADTLKLIQHARRVRLRARHLWSPLDFQMLLNSVTEHIVSDPMKPFNFVHALIPPVPAAVARAKPWLDLVDEIQSQQEWDEFFALLAAWFAMNILNQRHVFDAEEAFESLYGEASWDLIHAYARRLGREPMLELQTFKERTLTATERFLADYHGAHAEMLTRHRATSRKVCSVRLCLACFGRASQVILPCRHSLCGQCFRALGRPTIAHYYEAYTKPICLSSCPLCGMTWEPDFRVRLPPRRTCRLLDIDGGGVKGRVPLEVMRRLERGTGLKVPFFMYFDLMVGSSIGGIIALMLGHRQRSLKQCKKLFTSLTKKVFGAPQGRMSKIFRSLSQLARVVVYDAKYSTTATDAALREALGAQPFTYGTAERILCGDSCHPVRVVVTAVESRRSQCQLFTNYNKFGHPDIGSYRSAQESGNVSPLLAAEVARIGSAAPLYFESVRRGSHVWFDGGMKYNFPGPITASEARLIYGKCPDYHFSFGCGIFDETLNDRTSWWRHVSHSFLRGLDAHAQYQASLLWQEKDRTKIKRFNPILDMTEIPLDDISQDTRLQAATRKALESQGWIDNMGDAVVRMIASLFCFVFEDVPMYEPGRELFDCVGTVFFRYPEYYERFFKVYGHGAELIVYSDETYAMRPAATLFFLPVSFTLRNPYQVVDIRLRYDGREACISGLPDQAIIIWQDQVMLDRIGLDSPGALRPEVVPKRKRTLGDTGESQPFKRRL